MKRKFLTLIVLITAVLINKSIAQSNCTSLTVFLNRISTTEFAVSINPSDVYVGSYISLQQLSLDVSTFRRAPFSGINDIGNHIVTLTITNNSGNVSTCQSIVTVLLPGDPPPQAVCKNATIQLNQEGIVILSPSDIDNGSSSSVGIMNLAIDPQSFTCPDVGNHPVVLTVTDFNGNVATCTSTITVEDNIIPTPICKPLRSTI